MLGLRIDDAVQRKMMLGQALCKEGARVTVL